MKDRYTLASTSLPEVVLDSTLEMVANAYRCAENGWDKGEDDPKYAVVADSSGDHILVHPIPPYPQDTGRPVRQDGSKNAFGRQRTICGLWPKVFRILLGVSVVILMADIAGGVGGGMASSLSRNSRPAVNRCVAFSPMWKASNADLAARWQSLRLWHRLRAPLLTEDCHTPREALKTQLLQASRSSRQRQ